MGNRSPKRGYEWLLGCALNVEKYNPEDVAKVIAFMSVGDLRAMFYEVREFKEAFAIGDEGFRSLGVTPIRVGNQSFVPKLALFRALTENYDGLWDDFMEVVRSEQEEERP